jgi:hypothetical protein
MYMVPIIIAGGIAFAIGLLFLVRLLKRRTAEQVMRRFNNRKVYGITSEAVFFGQESLKQTQMRGNGVLALVDEELYFIMLAPKREFNIPWHSMQKIETPRSHLGKSRGRKLLKVRFINKYGEPDSMAWSVPHLDEWKSGLEKIIQGKQPG